MTLQCLSMQCDIFLLACRPLGAITSCSAYAFLSSHKQIQMQEKQESGSVQVPPAAVLQLPLQGACVPWALPRPGRVVGWRQLCIRIICCSWVGGRHVRAGLAVVGRPQLAVVRRLAVLVMARRTARPLPAVMQRIGDTLCV